MLIQKVSEGLTPKRPLKIIKRKNAPGNEEFKVETRQEDPMLDRLAELLRWRGPITGKDVNSILEKTDERVFNTTNNLFKSFSSLK